jgi:hypothetical protein
VLLLLFSPLFPALPWSSSSAPTSTVAVGISTGGTVTRKIASPLVTFLYVACNDEKGKIHER